MKVTNLISGSGILPIHDITDLMLRNALSEIERLEEELRVRDHEIEYYNDIIGRLRKHADCCRYNLGPFIAFNAIYQSTDDVLYADLLQLLQLEEPEEEKENEVD